MRQMQNNNWRTRNPDKDAAQRARNNQKRQMKRDAERAARLSDPAYIEALRLKQEARERRMQEIAERKAALQQTRKAAGEKKAKEKLSIEDRNRRRREAVVKAQRIRAAQQRAEREKREAEKVAQRAEPKPKNKIIYRRMGRFEALSKWHGY
jgi:hypothetical protein